MPRRTAAEAAATRRAILDAARLTFAKDGYRQATLDDIAQRAGVTRGAVHHHFGDKRVLFVEVFEETEREINNAVVTAALTAPPEALEPLKAGCRMLFDLFSRPELRRIVLADAPAVLGLIEWYEIDRGFGLATVRGGLELLAADGIIDPGWTEPLSLLLYGALTEAALALGTRQTPIDPETIIDAVERLITSFSPTPPGPRPATPSRPEPSGT